MHFKHVLLNSTNCSHVTYICTVTMVHACMRHASGVHVISCETCYVSVVRNTSLPYTVILIFFSGNPAAINGSLLPAFFVSLYGIKYPPTVTPTPSPSPSPSPLVGEYIWWIVGAIGGATVALIVIILILLVTYGIVRHKRQVGLLLKLLCSMCGVIAVSRQDVLCVELVGMEGDCGKWF